MNKKGFTLIELMGVIILLGIIGLIATMVINNTLKEQRENACQMQVENIISGAKAWASKNVFALPSNSSKTITLQELQEGGYVDKNIKNPITDKEIDSSLEIRITPDGNSYTYEVTGVCEG